MEVGEALTPPETGTPSHSSVKSLSRGGAYEGVYDSPIRGEFYSPREDSYVSRRWRRSYIDYTNCGQIERIRMLRGRVGSVPSEMGPYLGFRLRYAEEMARGAIVLSSRRRLSKSISVSPNMLFDETESSECEAERKRREEVVNALQERVYTAAYERAASEVERLVACEEASELWGKAGARNRYTYVKEGEGEGEKRRGDPEDCDIAVLNGSSFVKLYSRISELWKSVNAVVYVGEHRLTGVVYCIKRHVRGCGAVDGREESFERAMNASEALAVLRHANIVRFYNSWVEAGSVFLQMEYCLGGSLLEYLRAALSRVRNMSEENVDGGGGEVCETAWCGLSDETLATLLRDVAGALDYMHRRWSMSHGDVGLETILIQLKHLDALKACRRESGVEEGRKRCHELLLSGDCGAVTFKLGNFGAARRVGEVIALPPSEEDGRGADVLALGKTICLVASGSTDDETEGGVNDAAVPPSLRPILQLMLTASSVGRATAWDVLNYLASWSDGE